MAAVPGMIPRPQLGGTGPDADGGKERSEFEKQRQRDRGTGKDRPPVYKPSQSKPVVVPAPKKKIPSLTPGSVLKGSSAVHGMIPRY